MKNCYHIKISLDKTNPLIWREILVPDNYTFYQLHHTLQIVMGWTCSHLFEFNIEGFQVGYVFDDVMEDISHVINCRDARLDELITHKGESFTYWYDFGDSWDHLIEFEGEHEKQSAKYPICLAGERACPPEDVGGIPGYENFLSIIKNPKNKERKELLEWAGGKYDSEKFDPKKVKFHNPKTRLKQVFTGDIKL